MEVVGHVPPSLLGQLVKRHLRWPKTLHAVLYCFGDCAHHPARPTIITQVAELSTLFIIFRVFPIPLIVGTLKNVLIVSDCIYQVFKRRFELSDCCPRIVGSSHVSQLLHNRCLCVLT
jgi:hypothetical protein